METPESWFHRRATLYVEAQILFHLNQVGVFGFLSNGGSHTVAQIAESLSLDAGVADALLDYVFGVDDILDRDEDGRYSLSEFGRKVVDRFSDMKSDTGQKAINMFDVRVGAYGSVWGNLSKMLTGELRYGKDFHRKGEDAEKAVFKLSMNFWDSLIEHVEELDVSSIAEVGLTTGLLEKVAESYPDRHLYGLDRSPSSIERNAKSASAKGIENVEWVRGDFFEPDVWCKSIDSDDSEGAGLIYSLHFHELMARGEESFVEVLRTLKTALPNWKLLAFEQPRLSRTEKERIPETRWLYSQSNILIHHLIGNGRILSSDAWKDLGHQAGCRSVTDRACNYLGYRAFLFQL